MPELPLFAVDILPMRWGDLDALGHLNNTVYFRLFEEARVRWLSAHGWPVATDAGQGAILAATSCQYRAALHYPADLRLETRLAKLGQRSFTLSHRLSRVDTPEQTAAEAEAVIVWVDYASGQSQPLPDLLRQQLKAGLGENA